MFYILLENKELFCSILECNPREYPIFAMDTKIFFVENELLIGYDFEDLTEVWKYIEELGEDQVYYEVTEIGSTKKLV